MLIIKDKVKFPCENCIHKPVCNIAGKMEETVVSLKDDHFTATIDCTFFVPVLDNDN